MRRLVRCLQPVYPRVGAAHDQRRALLQADSLIFDLEDAVHSAEKDTARILLLHALPLFRGHNVAVRINAEESCWKEDLEVLRSGLVETVVVPKARAAFLKKLAGVLDTMGLRTGIAALIESTRSLEELGEIAVATPRLTSLLLGGEDYSLDLGAERTRAGNEIFYARTRVANAASAYHLEALDTPFADAGDLEGLRGDAELARGLGFTGKLAINPLQVSVIRQVFYPSEKEIHWAQAVLIAADCRRTRERRLLAAGKDG